MYRPESSVDVPPSGLRSWADARRVVPGTVWALGLTSLLTDVSAEMVVSVLPAYLALGLQLSPATFGTLDGLHHGATALTRWLGGVAGDVRGRYKDLALVGYGMSMLSRAGLLLAGGSPGAIAGVIAADRIGKGLRTAPRDVLISLSVPTSTLGQAFGVHRALDTTGALLGPLLAAALLLAVPGAYDLVFVTSLAIAIVGVAVLALFVSNVGGAAATGVTHALKASVALLRQQDVARLTMTAALLGLVTASDGLIFLALQAAVNLPVYWLPLLYGGTHAAFLVLAFPLGRISDRIGRRRMFLLGHVLLLLVYALLLVPVGATTTALLAVLTLGGYYAATDGVLMAAASAIVPAAQRGSGLALVATATSLGRMGAAAGFGLAWACWHRGAAVSMLAFALAGSLLVARRLLARRLLRPTPTTESTHD